MDTSIDDSSHYDHNQSLYRTRFEIMQQYVVHFGSQTESCKWDTTVLSQLNDISQPLMAGFPATYISKLNT